MANDAIEARGGVDPARILAGVAVCALALGAALSAGCKSGDAPSTPEAPPAAPPTASIQQAGLAASSASASPAPAPSPEPSDLVMAPPATSAGASIGAATMEPDGTIVLQLRAEGPGGARGDALIRYPKSDPEYRSVLRHLGGLKPGQSKPVPPWPDQGSKLSISRDGTKLGTLDLRPGKPGVLKLEDDSEDAKELKKLWGEVSLSPILRVKMHVERDGKRVYGAQEYKRGDANYAEGVRLKLLSEDFQVEELP